ncbi:MAG: GTPase domain-containing protein [Candidatus Protistobacter heckmanni]|nr:GTPase domain-containing protein [Candidatus Protistobacter heckmanni]
MFGIAAVAIALLSSISLGVALRWRQIAVRWQGKKIAILGQRGVGKTHLCAFLGTGSIPETIPQTISPAKVPARRFQLKELHLNLKRTLDLPGSKDSYKEWEKLVNHDDLVFYLFRVDRVITNHQESESRFIEDLQNIGAWLDHRGKAPPRLFLVGTHCDLDPNYSLIGELTNNYKDAFCKLPLINMLITKTGLVGTDNIVIGSLAGLDGTERLVYEIFRHV